MGVKPLPRHERQAAVEGQVAALVIQASAATGASALAFGTATGSFTLTGRDTATNALAISSWNLLVVSDRAVS
jgi:hypothetical protein